MGSKTSYWYSKFSWDEQATNLSTVVSIFFNDSTSYRFVAYSSSQFKLTRLIRVFDLVCGLYFFPLKYKSLCSTTISINILTRLALPSRCFEDLHLDGWNTQSKMSWLPTIQGVLKHPICLISHPSIYTHISYHLIQYIFEHLPLQNTCVASSSQKNYGPPSILYNTFYVNHIF